MVGTDKRTSGVSSMREKSKFKLLTYRPEKAKIWRRYAAARRVGYLHMPSETSRMSIRQLEQLCLKTIPNSSANFLDVRVIDANALYSPKISNYKIS